MGKPRQKHSGKKKYKPMRVGDDPELDALVEMNCDGSHSGPACGYDCVNFCAGRGGGGRSCGCSLCVPATGRKTRRNPEGKRDWMIWAALGLGVVIYLATRKKEPVTVGKVAPSWTTAPTGALPPEAGRVIWG